MTARPGGGWDGCHAAGLRRLRRPGRTSRPRAVLPVLASAGRAGRQAVLPALRPAAGPAARHRTVRALLAGVHQLRASGAGQGEQPVSALPARDRRAGRPADLPALRAARPAARGHRLVWALFSAPSWQEATSALPVLRSGAPPRRSGVVLGVLAAQPGPAFCPGREPHRLPGRPAGVAAGVHRRAGRPVLCRPRLHDDQHTRAAAGRRAPQPPPAPARTRSPPGTVDGLPGPCPGGLLHRASPRAAHRSSRAAGGRAAPAAHRRHPRALAPDRGLLRRVHAASTAARSPSRHATAQRPHHRDRPGHRARPSPVPDRRTRQARLGAGRRARHRNVPRRAARSPQASADRAAPVLRFRPNPAGPARRPDPRPVRPRTARVPRSDPDHR